MLRSRAQYSKTNGTRQDKDGAVNGEVGAALGTSCEREIQESGDSGELGQSQDGAGDAFGGGRGSGECGAGQDHKASWRDVVSMLVDLPPEDIFRTVVVFL